MLILVMWIAFGLVNVALIFGSSMAMEYRAAENSVTAIQTESAIDGERRFIETLLSESEEPGKLPDITTYKTEQVEIGDIFLWLLGRPSSTDTSSTPIFALIDEASKLNLNTATLEMLEALPDVTPEFAAAIIDWRDADEDLTPGGAESQEYLLRQPAYLCKNAPFETVDELRLVFGADMKTLYGEDANLNGVLDPNENDGNASPPDDNEDGVLDAGILEYVTVYSQEPNTQSDGSKRTNVNENRRRRERPYRNVMDYFYRQHLSVEDFVAIADTITSVTDTMLTGLINVNTASEKVLACVPGIGPDKAMELVAYREGKTDELNTLAWVTRVLDEESAILAGNYITTKSYQFSADIAAVGHEGKGFTRTLFIFDTSSGQPTVVHKKDRARLGWPLGAEIRKKLAKNGKTGTGEFLLR